MATYNGYGARIVGAARYPKARRRFGPVNIKAAATSFRNLACISLLNAATLLFRCAFLKHGHGSVICDGYPFSEVARCHGARIRIVSSCDRGDMYVTIVRNCADGEMI